MKNAHGNFLKNASLAGLLTGMSLTCAQATFAHDANFRDFVQSNPGIDKSALKQIWTNKQAGGTPGIGFGVIMPDLGRQDPLPPLPGTNPPNHSPGIPLDNFKAFKQANPGIDKHALKGSWGLNDPSKLGFGMIRDRGPNGLKSSDVKRELIPFSQFEELNPGIDHDALEQMYELLKEGNTGKITFGVISTPPPGAAGAPAARVVGNNTSNLLTMPDAYGVSLITGGK